MDSSATSKPPWDIVLSPSSSWASLCCTVTILMSLFFLAFPFFLPPLMFCSGTLLFVLGLVLQVVPVFPPHFFPFLPNVCFLFPILLSSTGPIGGCTADLSTGGTGDGKGFVILTPLEPGSSTLGVAHACFGGLGSTGALEIVPSRSLSGLVSCTNGCFTA